MNCHICPICNGYGCVGELPGMGGFNNNINFQLNVEGWEKVAQENPFLDIAPSTLEDYDKGIFGIPNLADYPIRLGPMTGGVENVGYADEKQFYSDLIAFAHSKKIALSIGDGYPDCKLQYGIEAVKSLENMTLKKPDKLLGKNMTSKSQSACAAVFIKPYPDVNFLERAEWAVSANIASHIGIDIDSYNILTMRNLVKLEKKSDKQLSYLKNVINKKYDIPFVIKGVFTKYDIELVKSIKPDIVFISNHGGRVENRIGSTAEFLASFAGEIKNYCGKLWVDGGIRTEKNIQTALALGADEVIIGRPAITEMGKSNAHQ